MQALISPQEVVHSQNGDALGSRVAQVELIGFEVAPPLFWVDCPDDCVRDDWYYVDGQVLKKPKPPVVEAVEVIELPPQELEF
jgi:hypothetical protein